MKKRAGASSRAAGTRRPTPGPVTQPLGLEDLRRRWRTRMVRLRLRLRKARKISARKLAIAEDRGATAFGKLTFAVLRVLLILTAPFVVLVRGAVWLDRGLGLPTWLALLMAGAATLVLLTLYGALVSRRVTGRARLGLVAKWVAAPLVVGYCGYALLHLSRVNAKDDAVRSVYTAAHPLLRVALTTLILADRDAVITDLARTPDDYERMGLPVNQRSLHYRQADGWVHAVDLRARGQLRSVLVEWYFRIMGFETLRHTGTGDHLHVSLPPATPPAADA
ncbi:MAG TPA: hypothetical protein VF970_02885 [Gemmatimonadales bacterium]